MKTIGSQSIDQKLKTFLFRHWEKIVLGLGVLTVVSFYWFGRVKPFDKTSPAKLRQEVETAKTYIHSSNSWSTIANFRKADDQAVEKIMNEQKVEFQQYEMVNLLGTKSATRGLRLDPELKKIMQPSARSVVGSLLIRRPRDETGKYVHDYWSDLITFRRIEKSKGGINRADASADDESGGLSKRSTPVTSTPTSEKKGEPVVVITDVMRREFKGIPPAKYNLTPDESTTMAVSAVAVTGLFPHEEQLKEYEKLKNATRYNELRDQPYYVYLQVQRRKMVDGKETEWEDITQYVTDDLPKKIYAATAPEIVEEQYVDPYLTLPIPPFAWVDFTTFCTVAEAPIIVEKEATEDEVSTTKGSRQISMSQLTEQRETEPTGPQPEVKAVPKYKLIRFFDMSAAPNEVVQYRFRAWLADPNDPKKQVYERVWNKQQLDAISGGGGQGGAGGDEGASGISGGKRGGNQAGNQGPNFAGVGNPYEDLFFHVSTEVRKRLKERDAKSDFPPGLDFLKYCRATEWSDATQWVTVAPTKGKLIAGRVETGFEQDVNGVKYFDEEPKVDIVVKKWDPALQVEVPVSRKVYRGSVMNFRVPVAKVINPISQEIFDVKRELIENGTEETGIKFATNAFVLDILGGKKMPYSTLEKVYFEPAEILVMNVDGSISVRNELADRTEFRHGTFADDEKLSDLQPQAKVEKKQDTEGGLGRGRGRGR